MRYVDVRKTVEQHQQKKEMTKEANKTKKNKLWIVPAVIVFFLLGAGVVFGRDFSSFFDPISIVSTAATPNLSETDGRTNILILGLDKRSIGTESATLTDTLLFSSIGRVEGNVAMISLPRDLWVKADVGRGAHYMKINSVYAVDGIDELVEVTEEVLGMPIHYYAVVDFSLFKNAIDILGGVEVEVENDFVDYQYPVEGKEADMCGKTWEEVGDITGRALHLVFPCRYETVQFEAGAQTMDGETALKYVRSRKGTNGEGTDFARSKRQQKLIMAVKDKVLSLETIVDLAKLKELYDLSSENVDTNVKFEDISGFYMLSQQLDFDSVRSIVLDDRSGADEGGLLYHPQDNSLYGGAYVLVPRANDFSQIKAYVQRYIFGE
jgi:polyisoprenyl-teichoic acid--peptidoglycan teichoic acid transferase